MRSTWLQRKIRRFFGPKVRFTTLMRSDIMTITSLTGGSIGTNCYILYQEDSKAAVVIDPGDDAALVKVRIEALGLRVLAILLTHAHFDHGGDAKKLSAAVGAPIYAHPAERELPSWLTHGLNWDKDLADGETLDFEGIRLSVLHTPGHTPGGVCFLCGDALFAGDTLFAGSCGRTDLPCGSWAQMRDSLRRLAALPGDYQVFPGHMEATTLETERKSNQYMQMALKNA